MEPSKIITFNGDVIMVALTIITINWYATVVNANTSDLLLIKVAKNLCYRLLNDISTVLRITNSLYIGICLILIIVNSIVMTSPLNIQTFDIFSLSLLKYRY